MMGRNRRHPGGRQGSKLKARLGIAAAVVVGSGAIGAVAVATTSHPSVTKAESAGYTSSYSNWANQGNVLNVGLSDSSWSQSRELAMFSHLRSSSHLTQMWHSHSLLAFERGRVVLATKNFVVVRSASGKLNVWWLSHGTKVTNVAASRTGTMALTGSGWATSAAMSGQMAPATAMLTGTSTMTPSMTGTMMTAQQLLAPTAQTVSIQIAGTGLTISITVTNNMAMVWQNGQTSGMWWKQPATMSVGGLQRGQLVFIAGTRSHWALHAKVVLIEQAATTTPTTMPSTPMTPTATPSMTVAPTAPAMGATPTPTVSTSVSPGAGGTHSSQPFPPGRPLTVGGPAGPRRPCGQATSGMRQNRAGRHGRQQAHSDGARRRRRAEHP
jgi:hypothetical protein